MEKMLFKSVKELLMNVHKANEIVFSVDVPKESLIGFEGAQTEKYWCIHQDDLKKEMEEHPFIKPWLGSNAGRAKLSGLLSIGKKTSKSSGSNMVERIFTMADTL